VTRTSFATAQRFVVKIGSALVQAGPEPLARIAADIAALMADGKEIALVSSGAVALGRPRMDLADADLLLEQKQAAAAAGQPVLVQAWETAFAPHAIHTAQALLTLDVTDNRRRWLNARNTLTTLFECGVVPVVNENDTIATDELRYGDNDRMAARVAQLVSADMLILLSDVDGLYDRDPRQDDRAKLVRDVPMIDPSIKAMAGQANTVAGVGTGGMQTKLLAADMAAAAGCATLIGLGTAPKPIARLASSECGTLFHPARSTASARAAWIAGVTSAKASITIDTGAVHALRAGRSLLPVGVTAVEGSFERGDTVRILDATGHVIARGVSAYDASDAQRIQGCNSADIESILGFRRAAALVHADDIVLVDEARSGAKA
jgi:glutamate 5-kinase